MALGMAAVLSRWWHRRDPVQAVFSEHLLTEIELDKQRAIAEILRARLARFPARQRRHYAPEERFEIIRLIHTHGISHAEAGHLFVVDPNTIARWEREVFGRPDGQTVGTLVRASPPLRGYGDVVVRLVQQLDRFGIGGSATIAQMLARAGIRISRETVRRYRKRRRPYPEDPGPASPARVLRARYANHIWLADLTEIRGLFGLMRFKLFVILDLFSRYPLAFKVFPKEPSPEAVLTVFDQAFRHHGRPRHFVSDQGSQFTARVFRETLAALSIRQRFGAIGQYGSIATIERFWRTLKQLLASRSRPPLSVAQLEARTHLALTYYATLRPHQGLDGATPAEVYLDLPPKATRAIPPPRIHQHAIRDGPDIPLGVAYLDRERRLPILVTRHAA